MADRIQRDAYGMIQAEGRVHFVTEDIDIRAETLSFDVESYQAELEQAQVQTQDGHRLRGAYLKRIDLETFEGKEVVYSQCPEDDLAWAIVASEARLDNDAGEFTARHARFEWAGIPVLYTPYWRHALTRRSGFLIPSVSNSTRRGLQLDIPFYWAASPNWDMTFTPRNMSQRGTMLDIEWRHRSQAGDEVLQVQGIQDKATGRQRGRLRADMSWRLSPSLDAALNIDALSDGLYIADYPFYPNDTKIASYLTSNTHVTWRDGSDSVILSSRYQQVLGGASNASTLQVLPRLQTRHFLSMGGGQSIRLEHQTTWFQREVGASGMRLGVRPSWSKSWQMVRGAVATDWSILGQWVGYDTQNFTHRTSSYGVFASSLQLSSAFEKVFANRQWRHEIKPVIRFDVSATQDQSLLPRYDSSLLPLNISNLLQGNRYSGWDRFEQMQRVSILFATSLQHKEDGMVKNLLEAQLGVAWDGLQATVDASIAPAPTRALSNMLAEVVWTPLVSWRLNMGGQYHQPNARWVEAHGSIRWTEAEEYIDLSWRKTDASYSQEAKSVTFSAKMKLGSHWSANTYNQYDVLRAHVLQTQLNVAYHHSCWDFSFGGYKTFQVGSNSLTDIGWRFLLTFDGLGSFGET